MREGQAFISHVVTRTDKSGWLYTLSWKFLFTRVMESFSVCFKIHLMPLHLLPQALLHPAHRHRATTSIFPYTWV